MMTTTTTPFNSGLDKLDNLYLKDLESVSPASYLSSSELNTLIAEYQITKNVSLRNDLLKDFGKFIALIAKKHSNHGLDFKDLVSEGVLGFFHALEAFDINKNVKFVTFAYTVVGRYMREAIEYNENIAQLPKPVRTNKRKTLSFMRKNGLSSLSQFTVFDDIPDYVKSFLKSPWLFKHVSLDKLSNDPSFSITINEDMEEGADKQLNKAELRNDVIDVMSKVLTDDEYKVISLFFGIGYDFHIDSYLSIAKKLGLNHSKVLRLKASAFKKLKTQGFNRLSKYIQ